MSDNATNRPKMNSIVILIPPRQIATFKAIIESYDNLATLRTEDPCRHHLKLWFDRAHQDDMSSLLQSLAPAIPVTILA